MTLEVFFIGITAVATVLTYLIYKKISGHMGVIERAYIDMSPVPPGLKAVPQAGEEIKFSVMIFNYGKTPGTILQYAAEIFVDSDLPDDFPQLTVRKLRDFFLMPNQHITWAADEDETFKTLTDIQHQGLTSAPPTLKLWLLMYVDYLDQFGQRHRNQQCRVYDRHIAVDNQTLKFRDQKDWPNSMAIETKAGYNIDFPIDENGNRQS